MNHNFRSARRDFLKIAGITTSLGGLAPSLLGGLTGTAFAGNEKTTGDGKILVVLELSGGNDGLNTLVPFGDDAYYRNRPKLGIKENKLRKIDDHFGFNPDMAGMERLYKNGKMAIFHGCGYDQPSFSHFTSMAYWHTAAPNSGESLGWFGRLADALDPTQTPNFIVNVDEIQSLAVVAKNHVPVVFDDPAEFGRKGLFESRSLLEMDRSHIATASKAQQKLLNLARSARQASEKVRTACAAYKTPVDYGISSLDLEKIAALINANMSTRLYYTSFRHNAFDTHVQQPNLHQRLLTYFSDAVAGFFTDLERIGRADDVVMLVFSEFGRRVAENTNLGTDHGTANNMYLIGNGVRGGHYGVVPSLTDLVDGNLVHTTDFRQVYATAMSGWLGLQDHSSVLRKKFETFPAFG
ncbi:MAG: DUF1501 domain-containing protein [Betaproteobacteria bacterium]